MKILLPTCSLATTSERLFISGFAIGPIFLAANSCSFFSLADDGNENEINPRVVAYKAHFLEVENSGEKYLTNSIIFDRGIWFANDQFENKDNIEYSSFYRAKELKTTGITANSSELKI